MRLVTLSAVNRDYYHDFFAMQPLCLIFTGEVKQNRKKPKFGGTISRPRQ
jgi:hypothetical protein